MQVRHGLKRNRSMVVSKRMEQQMEDSEQLRESSNHDHGVRSATIPCG